MSSYYVYILASHRHGTLYIGVTNNLLRRITEHHDGLVEGFTKAHDVKTLVYFEVHSSIEAAIQRHQALVAQLENPID